MLPSLFTPSRLLKIATLPYAMLICWIVLASCFAISTYAVFSPTWDEPEHLAAGLMLVDTGQYPYDVQHPPLARIAIAIGPYVAGARPFHNTGPSGDEEGRDILYHSNNKASVLSLARAGILPFLMILLLATWLWAKHIFGTTVATLATFFLATTPPVIGHAAVATLDLPVTAMIMLALYLFLRWHTQPTLLRAVIFGLATGLAAGTKLSAIPFIACTLLAWLLASQSAARRTQSKPWLLMRQPLFIYHAAIALTFAFVALVLCYGWHWEPWSAQFPVPVPVGIHRLFASLDALREHNASGHFSYFMGEVSDAGWWNYYLVVLGVKTPLPLLVLGLLGAGWTLWQSWHNRNWELGAPALSMLVILLFSSTYSQINIGVRHVMIVFPLLAIVAAVAVEAAWQNWRFPLGRSVLLILLSWQVVSLVRAHPDDLAYFNELAVTHPERIVVDSDLDWGQDIRRLAAELGRRNVEKVAVLYRGTADLTEEHLPEWHRLKPEQRTSGWIAVSLFAKYTTTHREDYAWLDDLQPVTRIGKSFDLYFIPPNSVSTPVNTHGEQSGRHLQNFPGSSHGREQEHN